VKLTEQTKSLSRQEALDSRRWLLVDAAGCTLGRLATRVAALLRGKHRPDFTPNQDCGDFVVVINAEKVQLTGDKLKSKIYYRHTGYPGGIRQFTAEEILKSKPERLIEMAVRGMLPKNRLGRRLYTKLKVYPGSEHPHTAQNPIPIDIRASGLVP